MGKQIRTYRDSNYVTAIDHDRVRALLDETERVLAGLIRSLDAKQTERTLQTT